MPSVTSASAKNFFIVCLSSCCCSAGGDTPSVTRKDLPPSEEGAVYHQHKMPHPSTKHVDRLDQATSIDIKLGVDAMANNYE